jgi:hypothetical protein
MDLKGATNVLSTSILPAGETLEAQSPDDLASLGIVPVNKIKIANLPSLGYLPSDKPVGLALLDDGRIAVLNDNDFGLEPGAEAIQLGIIDFVASNGLDASDRDDAVNIDNWPVYGMFMPDAITSYQANGETFYITANEGDARDEDERIKDLTLDSNVFPNANDLQENEAIGRLGASSIDGDIDGDGEFDQLFVYGGRSFSIWDANGNLVFDSGDQLEQVTSSPKNRFNSTNDENDSFDNRSDNKGPEPESVVTGQIGDSTYAFIGLERIGGVVVYDVTDPLAPTFETYFNTRKWGRDPEGRGLGDLGPEGLAFISASDSPNGRPLLAVAHEVSGSTTIFQVVVTPKGNGRPPMAAMALQVAAVAPATDPIRGFTSRRAIDSASSQRALDLSVAASFQGFDAQLASIESDDVDGRTRLVRHSTGDTDVDVFDSLSDSLLDEETLDVVATNLVAVSH